jgi:hypothetical protein
MKPASSLIKNDTFVSSIEQRQKKFAGSQIKSHEVSMRRASARLSVTLEPASLLSDTSAKRN